jgi:hypothetical protein
MVDFTLTDARVAFAGDRQAVIWRSNLVGFGFSPDAVAGRIGTDSGFAQDPPGLPDTLTVFDIWEVRSLSLTGAPDGSFVAAWQQNPETGATSTTHSVAVNRTAATGTFTGSSDLRPTMLGFIPQLPALGALADGSTLVALVQGPDLRSEVAPLSLGFADPPVRASDVATDRPSVAPDGEGGAMVAFRRSAGGVGLIAYDASPAELQTVSVPATATTAEPVDLSATARDLWTATSIAWDFGDGESDTGEDVTHAWDQAGTYQVAVRGADPFDQGETQVREIAVSDPPAPPSGGSTDTGSGASAGTGTGAGTGGAGAAGTAASTAAPAGDDGRRPAVTAARLARSVFAVGAAPTALLAQAGRTPRGTTLTFTLSEPARVAIAVQQLRRGFRVGRRCAARRPRGTQGRRVRRCRRFVTVGTLRRTGTQGPNRVAFSGRLGRRALRPASYRFSITVTDLVGNRSTPALIRFRIVRPRRR